MARYHPAIGGGVIVCSITCHLTKLGVGGHEIQASAGECFRIAREGLRYANREDTDIVVIRAIVPPTY